MKYWRKPLDLEKHHVPRGEVHVIDERCKGCGICVEFCPRGVLVISNHHNAKGYHPPRPSRPELCVDCDLCEMLCPEFAIYTDRVDGTGRAEAPLPAAPAEAKRRPKEAPTHA